MSDENNPDEANGDELEAMFARAALEEQSEQQPEPTTAPQDEMHDPLSSVMDEPAPAEESPKVEG